MPPQLLFPLEIIDFNMIQFSKEKIREFNQQRFEMEQLDGIYFMNVEKGLIAGYKDIREDEFWVKGHIPLRPLFPGVLMIESAAQLCSFYFTYVEYQRTGEKKFIGFGGVDKVKFRKPVVPGERFDIIAKLMRLRSRRAEFETQGLVDKKIVFEAIIIGMYV